MLRLDSRLNRHINNCLLKDTLSAVSRLLLAFPIAPKSFQIVPKNVIFSLFMAS